MAKLKQPSSHFYLLRYLLSLGFGWAFVGSLLTLIGTVVTYLFHPENANFAASDGAINAGLITGLVVSGIAYLFLSASTAERPVTTPKVAKAAKVLQTIFATSLVIAAFGFVVTLVYPLVAWAFGLDQITWAIVGSDVAIALIGLALVSVALLYHLHFAVDHPVWVYPAIMGGFAVIFIALFVVFPGASIRDAVNQPEPTTDIPLYIEEETTDNRVLFPGEINYLD
jgi:hypothetical protein